MTHKIIGYENGTISCCEYEYCKTCTSQQECNKCCRLHFREIKQLCDDNKIDGIKIAYKDKRIKCRGYCGYFQLSDDTEVYILPKIDKESFDNGERIFKNLIENAYKISNIKTGSSTSTDLNKLNLFIEILIKLFCNYMELLFKKGIKKFYSLEEDNLPYLKGKIKFSEHIKRNITSQEKFYVEYDDFTDNIAENRILKSACKYLLDRINHFDNLSDSNKNQLREDNKKSLRRYLQEFSLIEESKNLEKDFSKLQQNRLYQHYECPLQFAEVFLSKKNYWINRGHKKFPAILFSLHELFEDYIENILNEFKKDLDFDFSSQYSPHYLIKKNISEKATMFKTKMDFVLWNKNKDKVIIFDAKYKLINFSNDVKNAENVEEEKNDDKNYISGKTHISQSDLYQVFTYSEIIKKCEPKVKEIEIALLYPKTNNFKIKDNEALPNFYYFNGTKITFIPIDICGSEDNNFEPDNKIFKKFLETHLLIS